MADKNDLIEATFAARFKDIKEINGYPFDLPDENIESEHTQQRDDVTPRLYVNAGPEKFSHLPTGMVEIMKEMTVAGVIEVDPNTEEDLLRVKKNEMRSAILRCAYVPAQRRLPCTEFPNGLLTREIRADRGGGSEGFWFPKAMVLIVFQLWYRHKDTEF